MYYALITGTGIGCDYGIDCNKTFVSFDAKDIKDAAKEVVKLFDDYGGESQVSEIIVVEVATIELIDLPSLIQSRKEEAEQESKEEIEKKEREEYKRLHEKYGK